MILIALAFISVGYPVIYWGANNLKHWNRSVQDTNAASMKMLFGLSAGKDEQSIHAVPFPYKAPTTGGTTPSSNTPPSTGNNGGLSPNYPGGSGTIPTPPVGGTPV